MPTRKLIKQALIREKVFTLIELLLISNSEKINDPIIIGIDNKNENVVTSVLSPLDISPAAIVLPLLLIPGKQAMP